MNEIHKYLFSFIEMDYIKFITGYIYSLTRRRSKARCCTRVGTVTLSN